MNTPHDLIAALKGVVKAVESDPIPWRAVADALYQAAEYARHQIARPSEPAAGAASDIAHSLSENIAVERAADRPGRREDTPTQPGKREPACCEETDYCPVHKGWRRDCQAQHQEEGE